MKETSLSIMLCTDLLLAFGFGKYSPNTLLLVSIQSNSPSQIQNCHDLPLNFRLKLYSFFKGDLSEIQKVFVTCTPGQVCSKSRRILHQRTYGISVFK